MHLDYNWDHQDLERMVTYSPALVCVVEMLQFTIYCTEIRLINRALVNKIFMIPSYSSNSKERGLDFKKVERQGLAV